MYLNQSTKQVGSGCCPIRPRWWCSHNSHWAGSLRCGRLCCLPTFVWCWLAWSWTSFLGGLLQQEWVCCVASWRHCSCSMRSLGWPMVVSRLKNAMVALAFTSTSENISWEIVSENQNNNCVPIHSLWGICELSAVSEMTWAWACGEVPSHVHATCESEQIA